MVLGTTIVLVFESSLVDSCRLPTDGGWMPPRLVAGPAAGAVPYATLRGCYAKSIRWTARLEEPGIQSKYDGQRFCCRIRQ
jgi:hypothetical protein